MGRWSEFHAWMRWLLRSTTVTSMSGHLFAMTAQVGPPCVHASIFWAMQVTEGNGRRILHQESKSLLSPCEVEETLSSECHRRCWQWLPAMLQVGETILLLPGLDGHSSLIQERDNA